MSLRVYLGFDSREQSAFSVAEKTAKAYGCDVIPLYESRLRACGILTRPVDRRGVMYDINSGASQSTEFAISRFAVPIIGHSGWCLFADGDTVFMRDPHELRRLADPRKAVMVVKHPPLNGIAIKKDGQPQASYERKNWSSVMWFNCDHEANRRLNLTTLNQWRGADLHQFKWLADSEIGELPDEWNWLVGVRPKPAHPAIAHLTLGGPWIPGWKGSEHDDIWTEASQR